MICARNRLSGGTFPPRSAATSAGAMPSPRRSNSASNLVGGEQPRGHRLVVDAALEELFGRVAERRVPGVVEERREPHEPARPAALVGGEQLRALGEQGVEHPAGERHGAENVREAAVLGAGIDQEGEAELMNEAQALQRTAVDQRRFERVGFDEAVDRIAKGEHVAPAGRIAQRAV